MSNERRDWMQNEINNLNRMLAAANEQAAIAQAENLRLRTVLQLWNSAANEAEECELDDYTHYAIPMPDFCDAQEAMDEALSQPPSRAALDAYVAEPVAWMMETRHKTSGEKAIWISTDRKGWNNMESVDYGEQQPLYKRPPQVEAAVEGFRRRAMEACYKSTYDGEVSKLEYNSGCYDCASAIESLPAFEVKGE